MLQTKFVMGTDLPDLNQSLNMALSQIKSDNVKINYFLDNLTAVVEYNTSEDYANRLCCECSEWEEIKTGGMSGICHACGKKKRFSCRACESFK